MRRAFLRRPVRHHDRAERERDGHAVGEHVGGVGQQREGTGDEGGHRLHHHEGDGEHEGHPQPAHVAGRGAAQRVAVVVAGVPVVVRHHRILAAAGGAWTVPSGHNENHAQLRNGAGRARGRRRVVRLRRRSGPRPRRARGARRGVRRAGRAQRLGQVDAAADPARAAHAPERVGGGVRRGAVRPPRPVAGGVRAPAAAHRPRPACHRRRGGGDRPAREAAGGGSAARAPIATRSTTRSSRSRSPSTGASGCTSSPVDSSSGR